VATRKYERYVSDAVPPALSKLVAHRASGGELGPLYVLLGEATVPASEMRVVVRHVSRTRDAGAYPDNIDVHYHDVPQAYLFLPGPDVPLEVDFDMEEEQYRIHAPGAIFVPAGVVHKIRVCGGSGYVVVIMNISDSYNSHTFPAALP
jgi:mannose-6-phosphate isomerase-like protein (cupin superfamily)